MATDGIGQPPPQDVLTEVRAVVANAKAGDAAAVPLLRVMLDKYPALWRHYGDVAAQVELSWITLAAGDDLYLRESLVRGASGPP